MDWSNRWVWIGFGGLGVFVLILLVLIFKLVFRKINRLGLVHVSSNESLTSIVSNSQIEINIVKSNGEIEMTRINSMKTPAESSMILQHQRSRRITNI